MSDTHETRKRHASTHYLVAELYRMNTYCILRGQIKGFNSSITAIMCQVGSYRTVVGSYRMVE